MNIDALSPQDALVSVMIATAAADEQVSDTELDSIAAIVERLPVFDDYDMDRLGSVSSLVAELFTEEDGLDALLGLVKSALPDHLHETAYALACDIAAATWVASALAEVPWGDFAAAVVLIAALGAVSSLPVGVGVVDAGLWLCGSLECGGDDDCRENWAAHGALRNRLRQACPP